MFPSPVCVHVPAVVLVLMIAPPQAWYRVGVSAGHVQKALLEFASSETLSEPASCYAPACRGRYSNIRILSRCKLSVRCNKIWDLFMD